MLKTNAVPLAIGLQKILLDIAKTKEQAIYPIHLFEDMIVRSKNVSVFEASLVTAHVLATGIIREDTTGKYFTL